MTSVLNKIGQGFADQSRHAGFSREMMRPRALARLLRAVVKRRLLRQTVLPRDLWPTKAILGGGIDTSLFRDKVESYWGRPPFELYACTEGGIMAMQTWERGGLVFSPYSSFFEFIPMEESIRSREDQRFTPRTLLIDEVEPGETYEVVISNFYGMALARYRVGHYVEFLSKEESSGTLAIPQFRFLGRTDDRIDLAGFTRLDAKTLWEALSRTDVKYNDWTAWKEFEGDHPTLRLFIETVDPRPVHEITQIIHEAIKEVDPFYGDLEEMLNISPLRLSILSPGTFERFYDYRRDHGYELEMRTPPKLNPTEEDVEELLRLSG